MLVGGRSSRQVVVGPRPIAKGGASAPVTPLLDIAGCHRARGVLVETSVISVRGAREHNLKSVDVDLPKHRLVVVTGVSGSGKSSLAFDTVFAEGQRRYVESLSAYARQFLGQVQKPAYDSIRGLSPTVAIEQKRGSVNPRSTVGTVTEVYDYLRVLFARAGTAHCPSCARPVSRMTPGEMVEFTLALDEGSRWMVLAPLASGEITDLQTLRDEARRQGFTRLRVDGLVHPLEDAPLTLAAGRRHVVELVVDRIVVKDDARARLTDSIETALRYGEGSLVLAAARGDDEHRLSERMRCDACDLDLPDLSPQLFSFNSPLGMCPDCNGLGTAIEVDPRRVVPDPGKSLDEGAIAPWSQFFGDPQRGTLTSELVDALCAQHGIARATPWRDLSEAQQDVLLYGTDEPVRFSSQRSYGTSDYALPFEGIARVIERRWSETKSDAMRQAYQEFMSSAECRGCGGSRLVASARAVRFAGRTLPELVGAAVGSLCSWFDGLTLTGAAAQIARDAVREVSARLRFLTGVGLDYLTLDRVAGSLSGGESQRIRLASQIGTELTGVIYVLDEPSIGLHPRDNLRLVDALMRLRDLGNTVIVVEHDETIMRAADWIVDMGPGAGRAGGEVVAEGDAAALADNPRSLTGDYLSGRRVITPPPARREAKGHLTVRGARAHNLKGFDVAIPLEVFTVVTGVSGAGKSSLVTRIIEPAVRHRLHGSAESPGPHDGLDGLEQLDKIITIDQRPIGRSPRSNPATYTKVFDEIRKLFATTKEAKAYDYKASRFSFNLQGGRCEACAGGGTIKVEMHFLPDVYVRCERCAGQRFNDATLRVRYRGLTIASVLDLTVAEALDFFTRHKRIRRALQALDDVGLSYVQLGQAATTLSGGEAQRVKLSRELARVQTGATLYVLDEPTTGLHFADVERLLAVIHRLVDAGNTVLMIEHDLDLINAADHVIDLGPEGGNAGGYIVAQGSPEVVAATPGSYTGAALAASLRSRPPTVPSR